MSIHVHGSNNGSRREKWRKMKDVLGPGGQSEQGEILLVPSERQQGEHLEAESLDCCSRTHYIQVAFNIIQRFFLPLKSRRGKSDLDALLALRGYVSRGKGKHPEDGKKRR